MSGTPKKPTLLVVDDEESIRKLLRLRFTREGMEVVEAPNVMSAIAQMEQSTRIGIVVSDLRMPEKDGFELLSWIKMNRTSVPLILITGYGEKDVAVRALKEGAHDYLEKPFDLDELVHSVQRALRETVLEREKSILIETLQSRVESFEANLKEPLAEYQFKCAAMQPVYHWLQILRRESGKAKGPDPTVLIFGESGTGKEGVAKHIHEQSVRSRGPFIALNCASFQENLLESTLFGHERGAFTGANEQKKGMLELAKGGSVFFDEIGEMPLNVQARLLRVLQERKARRLGGAVEFEVDFRLIGATHRDLRKMVEAGKFRDDLYHRLCQVTIDLPALRDRMADLVPLAEFLGRDLFRARAKVFPGFSEEAKEQIKNYRWPGNVRELRNVMERMSLLFSSAQNEKIQNLDLVDVKAKSNEWAPIPESATGLQQAKKKWTKSLELEFLEQLLHKHKGNVSAAAREAEMDRSNLMKVLKRNGLDPEKYRSGGPKAA